MIIIAAMKTPVQMPSGIMPIPKEVVVRSCASQNASVMASLNQKIAATMTITGTARSSYQVTFESRCKALEGIPGVFCAAEIVLLSICA